MLSTCSIQAALVNHLGRSGSLIANAVPLKTGKEIRLKSIISFRFIGYFPSGHFSRLTRTITIEEFRTGDMAEIVEREFRNEAGNGQIPGNKEIQDNMNGISNGQEDFVVRQILTQCT